MEISNRGILKKVGKVNVSDMIGKTLKKICVDRENDIYIIFITTGNEIYKMWHAYQECCERVEVDDIVGDLDDLIGSPILMAEEVTEKGIYNDDERGEILHESGRDVFSFTWTFYKFATQKGYVTIKWYGNSNGFYSEKVDVEKFILSRKENQDSYYYVKCSNCNNIIISYVSEMIKYEAKRFGWKYDAERDLFICSDCLVKSEK